MNEKLERDLNDWWRRVEDFKTRGKPRGKERNNLKKEKRELLRRLKTEKFLDRTKRELLRFTVWLFFGWRE